MISAFLLLYFDLCCWTYLEMLGPFFLDGTAFSSMRITSPQEQQDRESPLCLSCRYTLSLLSLYRRRHEGRRLELSSLVQDVFSSVKSCSNPAAALRWKRVAPGWTLQCFGREMKDSTYKKTLTGAKLGVSRPYFLSSMGWCFSSSRPSQLDTPQTLHQVFE